MNSITQNAYLLSLERRPDRRNAAILRAQAAGLNPVWFPAVDGASLSDRGQFRSKGAKGHAESIRAIIQDAKRRRFETCMVIEDDAVFHPRFERLAAELTLPAKWAVFYFGCLHARQPSLVSPGVAKVCRAFDTHAVVFHSDYYDAVLRALEQSYGVEACDVLIADIQELVPCYSAFPNLAWQMDAGSDITEGRLCNYFPDGRQAWFHDAVNSVMPSPRRLLPLSDFSHIFNEWIGANVALYYDKCGNVGDRLIREAEKQLFRHYSISQTSAKIDAVFFGGGGNMGSHYVYARQELAAARRRADLEGVPLVVLPQSWMGEESIPVDVAYMRENRSRKFAKGATLMPDLGLAYLPSIKELQIHSMPVPEGFFFREDSEKFLGENPLNMGDPAKQAKTPADYVTLAASAARIHTDRLHFAISALIMGRSVTLHPNSYHKNLGVWETWLRGFGCEWSDLIQP